MRKRRGGFTVEDSTFKGECARVGAGYDRVPSRLGSLRTDNTCSPVGSLFLVKCESSVWVRYVVYVSGDTTAYEGDLTELTTAA